MIELVAGALVSTLLLVQESSGAGENATGEGASEPREPTAIERLFQDNCASCHGKDGDGQGTAELDRLARSFRDGGFSYGNTPEALLRTITIGIPGTPMPGFDGSLREEQRKALADYVLTLGPEVEHVAPEDTVLVVAERALVVRGLLPPIVEGAAEQPRGLLVGLPDGLTLEYRTDDVRLLGVRQGDFVERSDWIGRGGTPLAPLGRVVYLVEQGAPQPTFRLVGAAGGGGAAPAEGAVPEPVPPLAAFKGTWVRGARAGVAYALSLGGREVVHVEESARGIGTSAGGGFARSFRLRATGDAADLLLRLAALVEGDTVVETFRTMGPTPAIEVHWLVLRRAAGGFEALGAGLPAGVEPLRAGGVFEAPLRVVPGVEAEVEVVTIVPTEWNEEAGLRLAMEVRR